MKKNSPASLHKNTSLLPFIHKRSLAISIIMRHQKLLTPTDPAAPSIIPNTRVHIPTLIVPHGNNLTTEHVLT